MTSPIQDYLKGLYSDTEVPERSFGVPTSLPYPKVTSEYLEGLATSIKKAGFKMTFSWEQFADNPRQGHYEPVGVKWVQWLTWALGLVVFKIWIGTENLLRKFRHFEGVWGYEWEEAEYRPFKQKRKWVEDES